MPELVFELNLNRKRAVFMILLLDFSHPRSLASITIVEMYVLLYIAQSKLMLSILCFFVVVIAVAVDAIVEQHSCIFEVLKLSAALRNNRIKNSQTLKLT